MPQQPSGSAPMTVDSFLSLLQRSNLLTDEQWALARREAERESRQANDGAAGRRRPAGQQVATSVPVRIARKLVDQGLITRWQSDMLLAGRKAFFLGKYKLLDNIGVGGMGAVFKAQHAALGRLVALKLLAGNLVKSRAALARFHQEIQAAARLNHPNIVVAYDADSVGDAHFLVMEYVSGHDLGFLLNRDGAMPVGAACECLRQTAVGLQYAHEQGMVHRDIKPTNLLLTRDPDGGGPLVKILDMGLARFVSETSDDGGLTQTGQVLGTPDYISPEQAADTHGADIRSDIFSMGCTLFRLLTGEVPFGGRNVMEKLMARAIKDAPPIRTLRPDIPQELEAIVARMLARDPRDRYQTPSEVAAALAPFAGRLPLGEPAATPAPTPEVSASDAPVPVSDALDPGLEQFLRHLATEAEHEVGPGVLPGTAVGAGSTSPGASPLAKADDRAMHPAGMAGGQVDSPPVALGPGASIRLRRKAAVVRIGATLLMVACVLLIGLGLWRRLGSARLVIVWPAGEREGAHLEINGQRISLAASKGDSVYHSGKAGTWQIGITREGYEPIDLELLLARGEQKSWQPEWIPSVRSARQRQLAQLRRQLTSLDSVSSDDPRIAAWRGEAVKFRHDHSGTDAALEAASLLPSVTWPLDGLQASQISAQDLQAAGQGDAAHAPRALVTILGDSRLKHWNRVQAVTGSADGKLLASAGTDGTIRLWDPATGNAARTLFAAGRVDSAAFSPRDAILATTGDAGGVILWDAAAGSVHKQLPGTSGPVAFSADGTLLATQGRGRGIAVWNVSSGQRRTSPEYRGKSLRSLVFSDDRQRLASYGSDGTVRLWDVASGAEIRSIPAAHWPRFSPGSQLLAAGTAHGTLTLWNVSDGQAVRVLDEAGEPVAFSADGETLLSHRNGRILLWNLQTGDEERTLRDVNGIMAVSPDGRFVAAGDVAFGGLNFWTVHDAAMHPASGHASAITCLAFTRDSATLATGSADHSIKLWHPATGAERLLIGSGVGPGDLSPDGRTIAFATEDGSVKLWDVASRIASRRLDGDARGIHQLAYSPNGQLIAGSGDLGSFKIALRLWDARTGRELTLAGEAPDNMRSFAFSPDSRLLATSGVGRSVALWDAAGRKLLRVLDDHSADVRVLAFSPDSRLLAVACEDQTIQIRDLETFRPLHVLKQGRDELNALAFSPDGSLLAAGSTRSRVQLWNLADGKIDRVLAAPGVSVNSLAFSPTGRLLAAANSAGKVHLWHVPVTGLGVRDPDRTLVIGPSGGIVQDARFSSEGRHLLTTNGNGTIYILRLHEFSAESQAVMPDAE